MSFPLPAASSPSPWAFLSLAFSRSLKTGLTVAALLPLWEEYSETPGLLHPHLHLGTGPEGECSPWKGKWPQLKQPHSVPCLPWLQRRSVADAGAGLGPRPATELLASQEIIPASALTDHMRHAQKAGGQAGLPGWAPSAKTITRSGLRKKQCTRGQTAWARY